MNYEPSQKRGPPSSLVWTPIPVISWITPFIGHMGITSTDGTIFDFAAPYCVSVNNMAFGAPTKYYAFDPIALANNIVKDSVVSLQAPSAKDCSMLWDKAITNASREYHNYHVHNLFIDNCHSHIALCLNTFVKYVLTQASNQTNNGQNEIDVSDKNIIIHDQPASHTNNTSSSRIGGHPLERDGSSVSNLSFSIASSKDDLQLRRLSKKVPVYNVPKIAALMFFHGRYFSLKNFFITWYPFTVVMTFIILIVTLLQHYIHHRL